MRQPHSPTGACRLANSKARRLKPLIHSFNEVSEAIVTEQEWKTSSDLNAMLLALPRKGLDRKFRLFACACAWRSWHLMDDDRPRRALEVAERYADGQAD